MTRDVFSSFIVTFFIFFADKLGQNAKGSHQTTKTNSTRFLWQNHNQKKMES